MWRSSLHMPSPQKLHNPRLLFRKVDANSPHSPLLLPEKQSPSGRSSGVEHNLAKVGVEGSNPFARSSFDNNIVFLKVGALVV
jgi:hypothetical protein